MRTTVLICFVAIWAGVGTSAWAVNGSLKEGQRHYDGYNFDKAIPPLERALQGKPALTKAERIQVHLMLAICHYNLARSAPAGEQYRAALLLDPNTSIPPGQSPPAMAFFSKIKREFLEKQKQAQTAPKTGREEPFPNANRNPGKVTTLTPNSVTPRSTDRKVVARVEPPPSRPPSQPTPSSYSIWPRHRISIITGIAGVVVLGVGIGLGIAFQGQNAALQISRDNRQNTGEQVLKSYESAQQLVVPANLFLISGGVICAGAVGIFVAEYFIFAKKRRP